MAIDVPWSEIKVAELNNSDINILGVPFDGGVSNASGAAQAPDRLRELSRILPPFSEEGKDLRSLTLSDQGNIKVSADWEKYFSSVKEKAVKMVATDAFNLFLGGDHSVTIPLSTAFAERYSPDPVGMIHFDSHCDLMDRYDGLKWSHACPQRRFLEQANAAPKNLVQIGIRSYEAEELEFLNNNPAITVIGAGQFFRQSAAETIEQVCRSMEGARAIYLSLDIDVLDPAFAPGTGTPEGGGLTTRQVFELVRELVARLPVRAMDLVEVAPPLDHSDITSWAALKIIYELFSALAVKKA